MKTKTIVLAVVLIITFVLVPSVSAHAGSTAEVKLSPSTQSFTVGDTVTFKILLDTAQNPVNAAQINLIYPTDKLTFIKIDSSQSQFSIQAENKDESGKIKIARGSIKPQTGEDVKFADVEFSVKVPGAISEVSVSPDSAIVRSTDNTNILASGGQMNAMENSSSGESITDGIAGFTRGIFQGIASVFSRIAHIFVK